MAKESEIKLRVEPDLKAEMERYAAELGLSLSSYLRYLHAKHKRRSSPRPDGGLDERDEE